ncbi:MAG: chorismate-binding protein [Candidatus Dormibacteraeota bacterium]|uniref:Anthranilate synthase component 1 n=1 Tax=Candidatus Amunia macphersoniae TaxID=3127014 RepID=A0A934KI57_9BACT|nr:chorismate-binding protein [Candidatus Dormibacteraeota bacterium]
MSRPPLRPDPATAQALLELHDVVPLVMELEAEEETPVTLMQRLGVDGHCFLLESATAPGGIHGFSFLGHDPVELAPVDGDDPLGPLEAVLAERVAPVPGLEAPFVGGWVGYLAYEAAACYERLPRPGSVLANQPISGFALYRTLTVFDHARSRVLLITQIRREDGGVEGAYPRAAARLDGLRARVTGPRPAEGAVDNRRGVALAPLEGPVPLRHPILSDDASTFPRAAFLEAVARSLDHIVAGDIFQVQISRRFGLDLSAHPFTLYTALRGSSPTPYLFYVSSPDSVLVGASPEMLVRVRGDQVDYRPIAGTRRRGFTAAEDLAMEAELRSSEKEQAEHLMLVDLGRNDVGRVARPGSVDVHELSVVERYSNVMHLVSGIRALLAPGRSALDALRACFPAGTVTGAPKIRAMEIIAALEPHGRGAYAGAVGYIGSGGVLDTAIALRTVVVAGGRAYLQAAAGIVADSIPAEEAREIDNKLLAALLAVLRVNAL